MLLLGTSIVLLGSLPGCLATRGWVTEQLHPLDTRLSGVEGRLTDTEGRLTQVDAKADKALMSLDHLRLERKFVLSLKDGATFEADSDALSTEAGRQIDGFLSDLDHTEDMTFLIAGHTDSNGSERHNYDLGQRRAASVARYLITRKGVDPLRVTAMSYGASTPIAQNTSAAGRRKNRRIEILVYRDAIRVSSSTAGADADAY
jgi:outer membrane protein OmpA-like peptidoglycan-associated protein